MGGLIAHDGPSRRRLAQARVTRQNRLVATTAGATDPELGAQGTEGSALSQPRQMTS